MASVFVKSLRTIKSDITGEEKEYRVNNAVFTFLEADYKLSQAQWAKGLEENETLYGAYFVTSVMKANGLKVSYKEVLENTTMADISKFIMLYQTEMFRLEDKENEEVNEEEGE